MAEIAFKVFAAVPFSHLNQTLAFLACKDLVVRRDLHVDTSRVVRVTRTRFDLSSLAVRVTSSHDVMHQVLSKYGQVVADAAVKISARVHS